MESHDKVVVDNIDDVVVPKPGGGFLHREIIESLVRNLYFLTKEWANELDSDGDVSSCPLGFGRMSTHSTHPGRRSCNKRF